MRRQTRASLSLPIYDEGSLHLVRNLDKEDYLRFPDIDSTINQKVNLNVRLLRRDHNSRHTPMDIMIQEHNPIYINTTMLC